MRLQQASGVFVHVWAGADHGIPSSLLEDGRHFVLLGDVPHLVRFLKFWKAALSSSLKLPPNTALFSKILKPGVSSQTSSRVRDCKNVGNQEILPRVGLIH